MLKQTLSKTPNKEVSKTSLFVARFSMLLSFALRDVSRSRLIFFLTLVSLSVSFSAAFLSSGLLRGMEAAMVDGTTGTGGELSIRPGKNWVNIQDIDRVSEVLRDTENVESFSVRSHGRLVVIRDGKISGSGYASVGIDIATESAVTTIPSSIVEGRFWHPHERDGVVIGVTLADALEQNLYDGKLAKVGDRIRFRSLEGKEKEYEILGIVDAKYFHPNWSVYFPKEELETLDNLKKDDEIAVRLQKAEESERVKTMLAQRLGESVRVFTWVEREGYVFNLISAIQLVTGGINKFLVIAVFAITTIMIFTNVFQRRRQIAVLKSMGATNASVLTIYFLEVVTYLILSYALGFLVFMLIYIYSWEHPLPLLIGDFRVQVQRSDVLWVIGVWAAAAFIGGGVPAYMAARTRIANVLRGME
jgi:lipoprotein-releasing system permease protein